jgi:hypothetical protein
MLGNRPWFEQYQLGSGLVYYFDDNGGDSSSDGGYSSGDSSESDSSNEGWGSVGETGPGSTNDTPGSSGYDTAGFGDYGGPSAEDSLGMESMTGWSGLGSGLSSTDFGNVNADWGPNESFINSMFDSRGWDVGLNNWTTNNPGWNTAITTGLSMVSPWAGAAWGALNGYANNNWGQALGAIGSAGWGTLGGLTGSVLGQLGQGQNMNALNSALANGISYGLNTTGNNLGQTLSSMTNGGIQGLAAGMIGNYAQSSAINNALSALEGSLAGTVTGNVGDTNLGGDKDTQGIIDAILNGSYGHTQLNSARNNIYGFW